MLKIGHRGACGYAPENTLLSLRKALELGVDGIEFDVHVCKGGDVVVMHDDTLERTTSGRGKVADHTLAELKTLDAGQGQRVPTLEEFIRAAQGRTLYIELKEPDSMQPVADIVTRFVEKEGLRYEQLVVISFLFDTLSELKRRYPDILTGVGVEGALADDFMAQARDAGMWAINPDIAELTQDFVDAAHAHDLKVLTWTANTPEDIARAKAYGVDGIISDYPDRV